VLLFVDAVAILIDQDLEQFAGVHTAVAQYVAGHGRCFTEEVSRTLRHEKPGGSLGVAAGGQHFMEFGLGLGDVIQDFIGVGDKRVQAPRAIDMHFFLEPVVQVVFQQRADLFATGCVLRIIETLERLEVQFQWRLGQEDQVLFVDIQ